MRNDTTMKELLRLGSQNLAKTRHQLCSLEALIREIPSRRKRARAQQTLDKVLGDLRDAETFFESLSKSQGRNHAWGSIESELKRYALDYGSSDIALHLLLAERDLHGASLGTASSILVRVIRELTEDQSESVDKFLSAFEDDPSVESVEGYSVGWMRRSEIAMSVAWHLHERAAAAKPSEKAEAAQ